MEDRWDRWAQHVKHCARCAGVLSTIGNLDNHAADRMCEVGADVYTRYRLTTVRL
jgi:hypothetical protein